MLKISKTLFYKDISGSGWFQCIIYEETGSIRTLSNTENMHVNLDKFKTNVCENLLSPATGGESG